MFKREKKDEPPMLPRGLKGELALIKANLDLYLDETRSMAERGDAMIRIRSIVDG